MIHLKRIKELRKKRKLTQGEVAEQLNCSQQSYSNYELGQRDVPTDMIIKMARFFNVSADYLLEITDDPTPFIE